jgi:hypothetical protein
MIVLGADMHKSSHTITGDAAATGEMLGDKTSSVGARGFDQVLQWARARRSLQAKASAAAGHARPRRVSRAACGVPRHRGRGTGDGM